jgi:hypothetical protein
MDLQRLFLGFRHSRAGGNPECDTGSPPVRERRATPVLSPDIAVVRLLPGQALPLIEYLRPGSLN